MFTACLIEMLFWTYFSAKKRMGMSIVLVLVSFILKVLVLYHAFEWYKPLFTTALEGR